MVSMPTGEEPPKGYEDYVRYEAEESRNKGLVVDHALSSQLASVERDELKDFFDRHSDDVRIYSAALSAGKGTEFTFGPVKQLTAFGLTLTDMMVIRAYENGVLAGYAYVVYGWSDADNWLVDFMVVDPARLTESTPDQVAELIIKRATEYLAHAGRPARLFAVSPKAAAGFWQAQGFETVSDAIRPVLRSPEHTGFFLAVEPAS